MFTGAGRRGAANCKVGIPPAFMIATFIDPRWKTIQNLSRTDEPSKDAVKFKVLELKKLDEAGARVLSQLLLSFATFANSPLPPLPLPPLPVKVVKAKDLPLPLPRVW